MGRSGVDAQASDSDCSDAEDLPVCDFLRPARRHADHSRAEAAELVVLDSSDCEPPEPPSPVSHQEPCPVGPGQQGKVWMVSSDSEEEEASMPLALRLKQRLGDTATSSTAACKRQSLHTSASHVDISTHTHIPKSDSNPDPTGRLNAPLPHGLEDDVEHLESPKGPASAWWSAEPCQWTEGGISPPKKKVARRTPAEVEAARQEALRKRAMREKQQGEREERRLEMERQRAEKKALADAVKALRPEECIKHMVVSVDPALLQLEGGGALLTSLQALGCSCAIESQVLPCSVTWARRTPNTQTGEAQCLPESRIVILVPVEDFIVMIHSYSQVQKGSSFDYGPSLTDWTLRLLAQSPGHTLSLVVIDLEKYFRAQKSQAQKKYRKAVLGEEQGAGTGMGKKKKRKGGQEQLPEVSRVEVEEALVDLQLQTEVQVHFLPSWKEFSDYITMSTKAVAEAPFKRERDRTSFNFCLESEWAGGQKVDRGGRGLLQVWKRQIQQLNRVSPDIASAILAAYPSPQLLAQAYDRCRSEREKVSLLSDVLIRRGEGVTSTTRRVGPELSKRLFLLMTSLDPNQVLDSTGA